MRKTVFGLGRALSLAVAMCMLAGVPGAAQENQDKQAKNQPSDRTVRVIVSLAWALVPEKDKGVDGEEIKIDKSNPKKYMIPMGDARRIIRIANRTANAAKCELPKFEVINHRTLLDKEQKRGTWTKEQLYFIHRIHLTTVIVATGDLGDKKKQAESGDGVKTIGDQSADSEQEEQSPKRSCTSEEREQVKQRIEAYANAKG